MLRTFAVFWFALCCFGCPAFSQIIETVKKPPAILFKNAAGQAISSIPVDEESHGPMLRFAFSPNADGVYVLNAKENSKDRSLSYVNLSTLKVEAVIELPDTSHARLFEMLPSPDDSRLLCYTFSDEKAWSSTSPQMTFLFSTQSSLKAHVIAIDIRSNSVVGTWDWMRSLQGLLPDNGIEDGRLFSTSDGRRLMALTQLVEQGLLSNPDVQRASPNWQSFTIFSTRYPEGANLAPPEQKIVSAEFSSDERTLFLASANKRGGDTIIQMINLENLDLINRPIKDDQIVVQRGIGTFLQATPPQQMTSSPGVWVVSKQCLRFISTDGTVGDETHIPYQEGEFAELSLDKSHLFIALPGDRHKNASIFAVDLKTGTTQSDPLDDDPVEFARFGQSQQLWLIGQKEMRSISENGILGVQGIALDNSRLEHSPKHHEGGFPAGSKPPIGGKPTETIGIGDDTAALLLAATEGAPLHQVALVDLKGLELRNVITTMTTEELRKYYRHEALEPLKKPTIFGIVGAAAGAAGGGSAGMKASATASLAGAGAVLGVAIEESFTPPVHSRAGNVALAIRPDQRYLYVLDTEKHDVSVIDLNTWAVTAQIQVDDAISGIRMLPDATHLLCTGNGILQTIDLIANKLVN